MAPFPWLAGRPNSSCFFRRPSRLPPSYQNSKGAEGPEMNQKYWTKGPLFSLLVVGLLRCLLFKLAWACWRWFPLLFPPQGPPQFEAPCQSHRSPTARVLGGASVRVFLSPASHLHWRASIPANPALLRACWGKDPQALCIWDHRA